MILPAGDSAWFAKSSKEGTRSGALLAVLTAYARFIVSGKEQALEEQKGYPVGISLDLTLLSLRKKSATPVSKSMDLHQHKVKQLKLFRNKTIPSPWNSVPEGKIYQNSS